MSLSPKDNTPIQYTPLRSSFFLEQKLGREHKDIMNDFAQLERARDGIELPVIIGQPTIGDFLTHLESAVTGWKNDAEKKETEGKADPFSRYELQLANEFLEWKENLTRLAAVTEGEPMPEQVVKGRMHAIGMSHNILRKVKETYENMVDDDTKIIDAAERENEERRSETFDDMTRPDAEMRVMKGIKRYYDAMLEMMDEVTAKYESRINKHIG